MPYVVKNIKTNEKMLIPVTDNILKQIRSGNVTTIS